MISDSDGEGRRDAGQSLGMNQSSNVIASIVLNLKQSFNLNSFLESLKWAINVGKLNWMPLSKEMSTCLRRKDNVAAGYASFDDISHLIQICRLRSEWI